MRARKLLLAGLMMPGVVIGFVVLSPGRMFAHWEEAPGGEWEE